MSHQKDDFHPIEGELLPPESILNRMITEYLSSHELSEVTDTAIIDLYQTYCNEHPDLSSEIKERLPLTIQTLLAIRFPNKNET